MATNTISSTETKIAINNGDGNTSGPYPFSFSYLANAEVEVLVGSAAGTDLPTPKTQGTHYTLGTSSITFTSGNFPAVNERITIQRNTSITIPKVDFQDGSVLTESDLDQNSKQALFGLQEITDKITGGSGDYWGKIPEVAGNGVMEIGRYIDFHHTEISTADHEPRLHTDGTDSNSLYISGSTANQKIITNIESNKFGGASSSADGSVGLVPKPAAGDQTKYLKGDGTWSTVSGSSAAGGTDTNTTYEIECTTDTNNDRERIRLKDSNGVNDEIILEAGPGLSIESTSEKIKFTNDEIYSVGDNGLTKNNFTDTLKNKLDGIAPNAEVNVQSDWDSSSGDSQILNKPTVPTNLSDLSDVHNATPSDGQVLKWVNAQNRWEPGSDNTGGGGGGATNLSNTADGTKLTIESSSGNNTDLPAVTTSSWGVMTDEDKTKLDGIATGATANAGTITSVTGTSPIASSGGTTPAISISAATTSAAGSMSSADKTKLDGIAANATANAGTVTNVTGSGNITVTDGTTTPAISVDLSGYSTTSHHHNSAYAALSHSHSYQAPLTFGIANTNAVKIDDASASSGEYAKFTSSGLQGKTASDLKTDLALAKADVGLGNVENTAVSTWTGSTNIASLGTITAGTWQGTAIAATYVGDLAASKITSGTFDAARIPTLNQNTTGSAATLTTGANINGVSFDGSQAITVIDSTRMPLAGGTFTGSVTFEDAINENVYECTGLALDPDNGTIQYKTLPIGTTNLSESFTAGQSMLLMVNNGNSGTLNWPTVTWVGGGTGPTIATSGYSCVELWKIASTVYACHIGDVA